MARRRRRLACPAGSRPGFEGRNLPAPPLGFAASATNEMQTLLAHLVRADPANRQAVQIFVAGINVAALPGRSLAPECATFTVSPVPFGNGGVSETLIAAGKDSSTSPEEEPMYVWISHKPYRHHHKWRVWFRGLDGKKAHQTFETEDEAHDFIERAKPKLLTGGGHPIGDLVDKYLDERKQSLRASSIKTIEFRLRSLTKDREAVAVEAFPWMRAWVQHAAKQSVDSQHGILSSARGLVDFCLKAGFIRRDPLSEVQILGHKKRGKKQLHIDESRCFVAEALKHPDDPLAVACAAMIYTGLRPGEIMGLQVRDLDADGTILWVEKSKTEAGKRGVEVAEVFRPFLQSMARGRNSQDYLFEFKPERARVCADERKRRVDALLRRTRSLCKSAGLPEVCSHSMRGLHSTLAAGFGATGHAVAKALGHTSFNVTKRHYVDREVLENASLRSNLQVLQGRSGGNHRGNCPSKSVTAGSQTT